MLDSVMKVCAGLNEKRSATRMIGNETGGEAAKAVLWGSRLALDILSDGTARQYPEYEMHLARIALETLRVGDAETAVRLAAVYHEDLAGLFKEVIRDRLEQANFWKQLGAWYLIVSLSERSVTWAMDLLEKAWPSDHNLGRAIVSSPERRQIIRWPSRLLDQLGPRTPPHWLHRYFRNPADNDQIPEPWRSITKLVIEERQTLEIRNSSEWRNLIGDFRITSLRIASELSHHLSKINFIDPGWTLLLAGARFGECPSAETLATELRVVAAQWNAIEPLWLSEIPWPLAACVSAAKTKEDLESLAKMAAERKLGDIRDWQSAEVRWKKEGVTDRDFNTSCAATWPFDASVSKSGFPFAVIRRAEYGIRRGQELQPGDATQWLSKLQFFDAKMRSWLSDVILRLLEYPPYHRELQRYQISPMDYRTLFSFAEGLGDKFRRSCRLDYWLLEAKAGGFTSEWLEFLEWLGRNYDWFNYGIQEISVPDIIIDCFCSDPENSKGLLSIIAATAVAGQKHILPPAALDKARKLGKRQRVEANIIALGKDNLTPTDVSTLTGDLLRDCCFDQDIWRALKVAENSSLEQGARVALALLKELKNGSKKESKATERIRVSVINYLSQTPSRLDSLNVWEHLKFPQRLE